MSFTFRRIFLLFLPMLIFCFPGCMGKKVVPKNIAQRYLDTMGNGDVEGYIALFDWEGLGTDKFGTSWFEAPAEKRAQFIENEKGLVRKVFEEQRKFFEKVRIGEVIVSGDFAEAYLIRGKEGPKQVRDPRPLKLLKKKGEWKISLDWKGQVEELKRKRALQVQQQSVENKMIPSIEEIRKAPKRKVGRKYRKKKKPEADADSEAETQKKEEK